MEYVIYVCDVETTGLNDIENDVIEVSLSRLTDGQQKTWFIKPINLNKIDSDSLRINHHKLEDITHKTKFGQDTYLLAEDVIVDIENWIMEDGVSSSQRIMTGQNVSFDKNFLEQLWVKCDAKDSFPFGRRVLDTMIIEFFLDLCKNNMADSYSLNALTKKYGVKNEKAHSAEADVKATKEVLLKQIEFFKKKLGKSEENLSEESDEEDTLLSGKKSKRKTISK